VTAHMLAVLALFAMPMVDQVLHAMAQAARCWRLTHSHASAYTWMLGHPQSVDLLITQAPGQPGITLGFSLN